VKIVQFLSLPERGDVSDWLAMGHDKDDLEDWCCSTPDWEPSDAPEPTTNNAVALASNVAVAITAPKPVPAVSNAITLSFFSDLVEAKPKPWLSRTS